MLKTKMTSTANGTSAYSCVRNKDICQKEAYMFLSLHPPVKNCEADLVHVCKVSWNAIIFYGSFYSGIFMLMGQNSSATSGTRGQMGTNRFICIDGSMYADAGLLWLKSL